MANILVIDDDAELRVMAYAMLTSLGHCVVEASNGREGLQAIAAALPDLVICDIFMPEHDGLGMIIELRRTHPALPILAISGRDPLYLQAAEKLGAAAVLAKPFGIAELQGCVDHLLRVGCAG